MYNIFTMNKLEINTTNFQTLFIGERKIEVEYNIWGFRFFRRSFNIEEIKSVETFIEAIIVKTDNGTFKFPIADDKLRSKLVLFFKKEINFNKIS